MMLTPASLRSDDWILCIGISGGFQSESLVEFVGIRTDRAGPRGKVLPVTLFSLTGGAATSYGSLSEFSQPQGHRRHRHPLDITRIPLTSVCCHSQKELHEC